MFKLKELREQLGKEQNELSKFLNVSQSAISGWERERTQPPIEILIALADYFECSIDYLVDRSNELDTVIIQNDISSDERELINVYKMLDYSLKAKLIGYAYGLKEQMS